jgi:DNA-binding transcriptional ArsR family regulator
MEKDIFKALADPTRREIVSLLLGNSLTINEIAEKFMISRPAVSKHIKILTENELICISQEGRERYCILQVTRLKELEDWLKPYQLFWNEKLNQLETFLNEKKQ